jgi:hypothetical protein
MFCGFEDPYLVKAPKVVELLRDKKIDAFINILREYEE